MYFNNWQNNDKQRAVKKYDHKIKVQLKFFEMQANEQRKINEENRKKDDTRYNLLTNLIIRELKKRTLEFNDENINLVLDIALSSKHFSGFIDDDRIRIINAVKRKYNCLNKRQDNNEEQSK